MGLSLEQVAAELYAVPLADFVAERSARAKELKETEPALAAQVAKLQKPVVTAWLLDAYARRHTGELDDLLDLGNELREAQEHRDGDRVRALTKEAHEALRGALAALRALAGELASGAPDDSQVEQTLRTAMADQGAAAALRAGLLRKPLSPAGFGEVDLSGAVAAMPDMSHHPARGGRPRTTNPPRGTDVDEAAARRTEQAERALEALQSAEAELTERDQALSAAEADREAGREGVAQAEEALGRARTEEREAAKRERSARQARDAAALEVNALSAKAEQARRDLDRRR